MALDEQGSVLADDSVETGGVELCDIAGLRALWASIAAPGEASGEIVPLRPLLDSLGLGFEQTCSYLGATRPSFDTFVAWAMATGGTPDADRIERYHAWHEARALPAVEVSRQAAVMAQDPVFTPAELADWERDGVIVLKQAIDRDQATAVADHLWSLLGASPDHPDSWYGGGQNGIMVQHFQHPSMNAARRSRRIEKAFAELYGNADLIVSTDRLSFNPPERGGYSFPGPHLHWDVNLTLPMSFETQAILYLTDTAADQGALRVVPGFHHRLADGWLDTLEGRDPRAVDLTAEAVPIAGGAGDLVIWRQEIPHGASPNRAARPRMAQYVTMYPMHWPDTRRWR